MEEVVMPTLTHPRQWLALLASCSLTMAPPAPAQDLKCFILTPPEQVLPGVKRIAIADFSVAPTYKYDDHRPGAARTAYLVCYFQMVCSMASAR